MSPADALYRLVLRALPADVRADVGDDMVQMFRDYRRAERGRPLRLTSLWLAAIGDVVVEATRARSAKSGTPARSTGAAMRAFMFDLRHGFRLVRRYPATSLLAIATLALGIGANTAIFSVFDAVLLRAMPYPEADRIVMVFESRQKEGVLTNPVSPADFLDWRRMNTAFDSIAAVMKLTTTLTGQGEPVQVGTAAVSWQFFNVFRARPALGRTFVSGDEVIGHHTVVVVSHAFWRQQLGGVPDVVGRRIELNGGPWEIVGVLPADFEFIDPAIQIWAPLPPAYLGTPPSRVSHSLDVYARPKDGVTVARAADSMAQLGRALEREHPAESPGHGAYVMPARDYFVKDVKSSLVVLFIAVGLVLLIACTNVANLLLARAVSRKREMAVRAAIGATRGRLIVQTLVESLTLAAIGGVTGVALAAALLEALPVVMPDRLALVGLDALGLDVRVLFFAIATSIATGLLFGLLPAIQTSRPNFGDALTSAGRSAAGVRRGARLGLVIGEVALASLILFGAGLVVRSFNEMRSQPVGFEAPGRLTVPLAVGSRRYPTPEQQQAALAEIETRFAAIPGVSAVGAIDLLPLAGGNSRTGVAIEGREAQPGEPPTRMHPRVVTPGYFSAMGIPIVKGRAFSPADSVPAEPVVIVSETAAKQYWPGLDPVGKRLRLGGDPPDKWRAVVGVAGDVRHWGFTQDVNPMLYWPQAQARSSFLTFVLQTSLDPASLTSAVRAQVAAVDPNLPVTGVRTLDQIVRTSLRPERAQTVLMTAFGVLALLLAVIGIYGVTSQLVTARVHDIGVRMTLGARPLDILRQLLAEGLWQTLAGLAVGLFAGTLLMRIGGLSQSLLYRIHPWDPITLAGVSVVLLIAALAACLIPARRAMRVDPVEALRYS